VTGQPRPNYRLARPLFIREASSSFGHIHHTISVAMKKCASLGGTSTATGGAVKEGFGLSLGISWLSGVLLFLVKEYKRIFCSVSGLSILRKFLLGFLPHEGFPR
jgi:hypothetical protein